jgi:hypothetical protein
MADTNPLAPGNTTSEFRLTQLALVAGVVLEGAGGVIQGLQSGGVNATWFAIALAVIGMLVQVCSLFGYVKGRAVVKAAALTSLRPSQMTVDSSASSAAASPSTPSGG